MKTLKFKIKLNIITNVSNSVNGLVNIINVNYKFKKLSENIKSFK